VKGWLVTEPSGPSYTRERLHFLDSTRSVLILLGIPYHAALAFAPGNWIVNMPVAWAPFGPITEFVHAWRMPGFFFIAGLLSSWTIARRPASAWFRTRSMRLGLPLLGGILLVNVPTALILTAISVDPLVGAQATFVGGVTPLALVEHLWFLPVLLLFAAAHAAVVATGRRIPPALQRRLRRSSGPDVVERTDEPWGASRVIVGTALVVVLTSVASAAWNLVPPELAHEELVSNVGTHASFYLAGGLIALIPDGLRRLVRTPVLPIVGCVAILTAAYLVTSHEAVASTLPAVLRIALGCTTVTLLLCVAARIGDRRNARIEVVVAGAIVFYIVHQPALVFTDLALAPLSSLPLLVFAVSVGVAGAFAAGVYAVVRRFRLLRIVFCGSARPVPPLRGLLSGRGA
jgi:glucan biosynthesis protein C